MSHSVFRVLDEDKSSSGIGSNGDVADNNLIVFIDKDDDVRVDPNALQDFIVNANTDSKATVSVIRLGSPTPSMEEMDNDDDEENSTKSSDAEDDDQSNSDDSSKTGSESNPDSDENEDSDEHQKSKKKKKKRKGKNKVPSFGLTVEDFFNPQQAIQFATEIMSIAGITDPKQLKADYDHLRFIIANDHCYTPHIYPDSPNAQRPDVGSVDGAKRDTKNKSKLVTSANTANITSTLQSSTGKKNARSSIASSKSQQTNGLDRDASNSARNRSAADDANSSTENTGERSSDEEEAESEEDFSDMTPSESDNDRDSDLDFSVNDCHSKRAKKISKRKIRAKKLAAKKRRRSTVEFTGSDDVSTPNRKKTTKLLKKTLNTSSKASTNQTPTSSTVSTNTKPTPTISTSGPIKSPAITPTPTAKSSINSTIVKPTLPVTATSTPRITKLTYPKQTPSNVAKVVGIQKANNSILSTAATTASAPTSSTSIAKTAAVTLTTKPTATNVKAITSLTAGQKTRIVIMKQKDRKPQTVSLGSVSSLFAPDVIKKPSNATGVSGIVKSSISTPTPLLTKVIPSPISKTITPITNVHAVTTTQQQNAQRTNLTKLGKPTTTITTYSRKAPKSTVNLASEQDKQLDLIDSLLQEEFSRSESDALASASNVSETAIPAAIPNIVKMLETSDASTTTTTTTAPTTPTTSAQQTPELSITQPTSTSANSMSYTTTSSVTDSAMLPDDLLEFVNDGDFMQHVATLVDDKNMQEIIDNLPPASELMNPHELNQTAPSTFKIKTEEPKTPVNVTKPLASGSATIEGRKVKRSDGSFITLPPIEAPTTRGAKRRAETTPSSDIQQPKQKVFTVIVQTESPGTVSATTPNVKSPASVNMPKAKPINVRDRRASVAVKRSSIESKPRRSMSICAETNPPPPTDNASAADDDDDEEEDASDGTHNSEDDPHRLWCICRTPHNNRFMICCDKCEEWFHGKCVGITRKIGHEMEKSESQWICPTCEKKQQPSIKNIFPRKLPLDSPSIKMKDASSSSSLNQSKSDSTVPNCMVCKIKPSRTTSVYCSDDCIRKHASTTTSVSASASNASDSDAIVTTSPSFKSPTLSEHSERKKTIQPKITSPLFKDKANHVVVFDKSSGKYLTGKNAPTADKLQQWLNEHPTYEVLTPGTPQAAAFKAKQQQLKSIAKNMNAERELFAVTQPNKIQTKLRFEADKMVYVNPSSQKQPTSTTTTPSSLKRPISAISSSSPGHTKSAIPSAKTPKLTSTPAQKTIPIHKKRSSDGKSSTPIQSKPESSSKSSSNERDNMRLSVQKSLIDHLIARTKEIVDPNAMRLTEAEIKEFVRAAEQEMFAMFGGDTNMKYKTKYRSLIYNIKDRKNLSLFEKISKKMIEPKQLVRMSTEELASQELAEWRNNENKHQLEMITKSELDMLASGNTYVLKTHKGEEVIQDAERISLDRSLPVEDLVSALNSSAVSSSDGTVTKDSRYGKYLSPDGKSSSHSSSKRDGSRSHEKDKKSDRHESRSGGSSSKHKRKRSRERHSSHSHSHKDKERDKKERSSGDKKERSSGSDRDRRDRDRHKSSSSKHHDKDRLKREASNNSNSSNSNSNSSSNNNKSNTSAVKAQKPEEISMIDKILKAESTINSILHPEEYKKSSVDETSATAGPMNVSSGSLNESTVGLTRQPSAANESDQEPTSTVTSPPEVTPELQSATPPPTEKPYNSTIWTGNINMIDVATFQVSLEVLSGSTVMIDFPKEFDVVGRIGPETVWDYLEKIRLTKDIVLLRFSPLTSSDEETAYSTFIQYLDTRQRLGVIKIPSKLVKDFYILPLTSHKSLPSILKTTTGFDLGANRPDLLLGIIVRNRVAPNTPPVHILPPLKYRQSMSSVIPFIGHKPMPNIASRDEHYTPPSSPNISHASTNAKQMIKSFASNLDDDEPYSPGGSDEDSSLNAISTAYLPASTINTINPINDYATKSLGSANSMSKFDQEKLDELNRQIEAERKQIAIAQQALGAADIDEPYSPTSSVSPPINSNLSINPANISIPANLADILKNVASFGTPSNQMPINQYSSMMDTSDNEYVPVASGSTSMTYAPVPTQLVQQPILITSSSQPSKLAQLTDEELLRLVPDEI